jgi:hypothetical protein
VALPPSNGRRRLPRAAAAVLVLSASVLAACGGSSDKPAASGDAATTTRAPTVTVAIPADRPVRGACGLVTPAEVEAAVGAKVGPGKETPGDGRSTCVFTIVAPAGQSVVLSSLSSSAAAAAFDDARTKVSSPQSVSAGDQAYVSGGQAVVRKGDTMVAVLVNLRQPPAQLSAVATKLAQAVGTHL